MKSNDGETPDVIKGKLDLSKKGYGKLSLRHKNAYGDVKFLDISHNTFKYVNGLNLFSHCIEVCIDVDYVYLWILQSICPLHSLQNLAFLLQEH